MEAPGGDGWGEIEELEYPACTAAPALPAWNGWEETDEGGAAELAPEPGGERYQRLAAGASDFGAKEEVRQSYEAGRERGRQEGRHAEREAQVARLAADEARRKQQIAALTAHFAEEGDRFLHEVEQQVVKLALAIAARVLRREAQMDPLLLTGAVRVALGQLAASSEVHLQVPAKEADLWTETMALVPHLAVKAIVVPQEGMCPGDCIIESKAGTVDLGVRSQLAEIERGFFDRAGSVASEDVIPDARVSNTARPAAGDRVPA